MVLLLALVFFCLIGLIKLLLCYLEERNVGRREEKVNEMRMRMSNQERRSKQIRVEVSLTSHWK